MKLAIYEIVDHLRTLKQPEEKIDWLKANHINNLALKTLVFNTYRKDIQWLIPDGEPPFKRNSIPGDEYGMYNEYKRFRIFIKGNEYDHLKPVKREGLYIGMLEYLNKKDADLVLGMVNGKRIVGLPEAVVREVWPDMLPKKKTEKTKKKEKV